MREKVAVAHCGSFQWLGYHLKYLDAKISSMASPLQLDSTRKFTVLSVVKDDSLPVMNLSDLLLHTLKTRDHVQHDLQRLLKSYGYVILKINNSTKAAQVIDNMRQSLCTDFFPSSTTRNSQNLQQGEVYISERGVPMWKTGYELCDDIREAFRVHCGAVDDQPWPTTQSRQSWLQGMALCRHICDVCLDLIVGYDAKVRPYSGGHTWTKRDYSHRDEIAQRHGDFSVLYAMHYFNDEVSHVARQSGNVTGTTDTTINVKEHVDPSLFVLEPFLAKTEGLQVFCQKKNQWITCDGPKSPIHSVLSNDESAMVLILGKALAANTHGITPTLHRVIATPYRRRTMIYEQKYQEFFSSPGLD